VIQSRRPFLKIYDLLTPDERVQLGFVLTGLLIVAVLQMIGIASILPFVAVVTNPDLVAQHPLGARVAATLGLDSHRELLIGVGSIVLALVVVGNLARAASLWISLRYENRLTARLAHELLRGYARRPYTFFLNRNVSELGKNVLTEVRAVVSGVVHPGLNVIANALVVIGIIALLLLVNPGVALVIAIVLGGVYGAVYWASRRLLKKISIEQVSANAHKYRAATELMAGIKDLKILGREEFFLDRFRRHAIHHARNNVFAGVLAASPRFFLESIAFGGMVALLLLFISRGMSTEELVPLVALYAFAGYRVLPAFQSVYAGVSQLRYNIGALDVLYRDMTGNGDAMRRAASPKRESHTFAPTRSIGLENVSFRYPGAARLAVRDFTIQVEANTTVALVGPSGSGKTTAVDILLGLLAVDAGRLLVDDEEITTLNLGKWQQSVGYVPQSIYLVDETLTRNIALGIPDSEIDAERVERAARAANLHDFIVSDLPEGYETVVGDRGVRLSGGQRQRVGIARALYNDPPVLIFDEATSALDGVTEDAIMTSIRSLAGKKTIVIIAHRLSTVQHADRIFLVDQGRVVASGSYDELKRSSTWFRSAAGA